MITDDIIEIGCVYYKTYNFAGFYKRHPIAHANIKAETSYLSTQASTPQRIWHILHGATVPVCVECESNQVKWEATKKKYVDYCSVKCSRGNVSSHVRSLAQQSVDQSAATKKRQETLVGKHGTIEAFYNTIKDKRVETMLENHGVAYTAQSSKLREKMNETCIKVYNTKTPMRLDHVKHKQQTTNTFRYGTKFHQLSEVGKIARKKTNNVRYGGDTPFHSTEVRAKGQLTMYDRYGVVNPSHSTQISKKRSDTISNKYNRDNINRIHLTKDQLVMLSDVAFLTDHHHNQKQTIVEIAAIIGVDPKTVASRMHSFGIVIKRFQQSAGERELVNELSNHNIECETSNRTLISPYELDIVIPHAKIAIEYCGLYWHSDIHPRMTQQYHNTKRLAAEAAGYQLLTIYEDEWIQNRDIVTSMILHKLHKSQVSVIYGRKCTIRLVSNTERKEFLNTNHIQGNGKGSVNIGLFNDNTLVGVMVFIAHKNGVYELNRFASLNVVGGFSKLLAHFRNRYEFAKIVSYADLRYSIGSVYTKNGFTAIHDSRPSYYYLSSDKKNRLHRSKFRRCNLSVMLPNFNPLLTEFQNCDNNGILRVWDCGLRRFELI